MAILPSKWALVPVDGRKCPIGTGWQKNSRSASDFMATFGQTHRLAAIGVLAGPASDGLVLVDVDGASTKRIIEQLSGRSVDEALPPTVALSSGKIGRECRAYRASKQYWGAIERVDRKTGVIGPDGKEEALDLRWGNEFRAFQSVVAGVHPDTGAYQWAPGCAPDEIEVAEAPLWMIESMLIDRQTEPPNDADTVQLAIPPAPIAQPIAPAEGDRLPTSWDEVLAWLGAVPCDVPLKNCLSRQSRNLLDGVAEGGRNVAMTALARDLLGTEAALTALWQSTTDDAETLFQMGCDRCSPPLSGSERSTIWRSAINSNPGASLSGDAILNCLRSHWWKTELKPAQAAEKRAAKGATTAKGFGDSGDEFATKYEAEFHAVTEAIGGQLAYNELTKNIEFDGAPIEFDDLERILALDHGVEVRDSKSAKILTAVAKERSYHPIKQQLTRFSEQYGTDTTILNTLCQQVLGSTDPLHTAYLKRTLIGAVARIMDPGCKLDTVLILQGSQGLQKSKFFKHLAGADFFDDSLGSVGDKDEKLKLHQFWFIEWAELECIFKKRDIAATKAFLSSSVDNVRPPYGRSVVSMKRSSVIVGTTNEAEFLGDSTGNRRFWVIPVTQTIDIDWLDANRDRIWAAALAAYNAGEQWWLTAHEDAASSADSEQYSTSDPWDGEVATYVQCRNEISVEQFLIDHLKVERKDLSRRDQMRVAQILRRLNWTKERVMAGGVRKTAWSRPIGMADDKKGMTIAHNPTTTTVSPLLTPSETSAIPQPPAIPAIPPIDEVGQAETPTTRSLQPVKNALPYLPHQNPQHSIYMQGGEGGVPLESESDHVDLDPMDWAVA